MNEEDARKQSLRIHQLMMQMVEEGYLVVRSLSGSGTDITREEYLWISPDCYVAATFTKEFGEKLWRATEYWKLATTKRYTRKSQGVVVDQELVKYLKEAIAEQR